MILREYQKELIQKIRQSINNGNRSVVAVLGCGGGKSIIQADIAKNATQKENSVLFIVHRKELCNQIYNTFKNYGVNMDLCDVCMVQTISRNLNTYKKYSLILIDECHHSTANTYIKVFNAFPLAIRIGFTATPIRLNKGGLGDIFSDLITSVSTQWLIENNFLSHYKYYSVKLADTSKLHTVAGDYNQSEIAELMQDKEIYGDTVNQWERLALNKKTIIYCSSVQSSSDTAQYFKQRGFSAISIDGKMPAEERKNSLQAFRNGKIKILCNCELFGEGLDVPDCECVVLLRPTQSLTLFIQQSMRAMRFFPNKQAIIIDHVGNCYLHGLPDDEREWSLEPKKKQETTIKIRECKQCFAVYPPNLSKCPFCGAESTHETQTKGKKTIDIDLVEVQRQEKIKKTSLFEAELTSWEQIVDFQKIHKYKFAWCLRYALTHNIEIPKKYKFMALRFLKI